MASFSRSKLLHLCEAGRLILLKSESQDAMGLERFSGVRPVRLESEPGETEQGVCVLSRQDFKSDTGGAFKNQNGTVLLRVTGSRCYTFRITAKGA